MTEQTGTVRRRTAAAVLFCVLLFALPAAGILQKDKTFSETEKRVLSSFPHFSLSDVWSGKAEADLESYVQDQMPWRNLWVGLAAYFDYAAGQNGPCGVYAAADDYIMRTPTEDNRRNLDANLRYLNDFAQKAGKPSYLLVVPQTGYILSDLLPRGHAEYTDAALLGYIGEKTQNTFTQIDCVSPFAAHAQDTQLYYRTDHHWTSEGAFLAANAFLQAAGRPALTRAQFEPEAVPGFHGTTYSKLCMWGKPADDLSLWHIRGADAHVRVKDLGKDEITTAQDVFFRAHLDAYDMYPTYLNGNHSLTHIVNRTAPEGALLLIKDSFGNTLATLLSAAYREIWMIDLRYYRTQAVSDLLAAHPVDDVLVNYGLDSLIHDTNILWLK